MATRIGIDLGGTKIAGMALADDGRVLAEHRIATPRGNDYDAILAAIGRVVAGLEREAGPGETIGIGTPGAPSLRPGTDRRAAPWKNSNTTCINGRTLHADLEQVFGRPIRIANDANCFAVSEAGDGAAAGQRVVFGVIIGTGTGGGIAIDGSAWEGPNACAGEWGHSPLPWPRPDELPGHRCYCGKHGCLETWVSGPAVERLYEAASGERRLVPEIALRVAEDTVARRIMADHADRLGRGLAAVINLLDPDAIVLGGGLSNLRSLYGVLPGMIARYVFSDSVVTPVVRNRHGDASGVRGAARLWPA